MIHLYNQHKLDNNKIPEYNKIIQDANNSTCAISIDDKIKGLGFLVSLPININNRYISGLLTSNKSLSNNDLIVGKKIQLYFKSINIKTDFTISENTFVFSCDFLGFSFVEIDVSFSYDFKYLRILEEPFDKQNILVYQFNKEKNFDFIEGYTLGFYGTYILFKVKDSYVHNAICTPIISLSEDSFGDIIGIITYGSIKFENDIHTFLNINFILRAIKCLVHQNKIKPSETLSQAKKLTLTEIHVLRKEGLKETENQNVFISPGSQGITPLWFYRTHYAWYWTSIEPKNIKNEELKMCNWSLIQGNFPIKAIGGMWNGLEPAQRNVVLIKFLLNSGLKFLMD